MQGLVAINIRKAIDRLNASGAPSSFELLSPVFCGPKKNITCTQPDLFGFYVLASAIRSLFRGINFAVAARSTLESGLLAPSIALSYTGAFHGLMTYLALEGRPHFEFFGWAERQSGGNLVVVDRPDALPIIAAILTTENTWSFEGRTLSHKARWRELVHLFGKRSHTIPQYYRELFKYMFRGRQKKRIPLKDVLMNPTLLDGNRLELEDAMDEFLDRIAAVRHVALYRAVGEDPRVIEAIWNNEATSSSGIEQQALEFYSFCEAMFDHVSSDIASLISLLNPQASVRNALYLCIYLPGVDTPRIDDVSPEVLKSRLCGISRRLDG